MSRRPVSLPTSLQNLVHAPKMDRRNWLRAAGVGAFGASISGWFPAFADQIAADKKRKRHCILLWMPGAPSQTDTFDMKPDHENGGEFKEIATSVPGLKISEHLPQLAKHGDQLAIVRSLSTKEGDHGRGTYLMRTGDKPMGPVNYPAIGASLAKQMAERFEYPSAIELPSYVSVGPFRAFNREAFGPGFLGPRHAPLVVGAVDGGANRNRDGEGYARMTVEALNPPNGIDADRMARRLEMWRELQQGFLANHPDSEAAHAHDMIYKRTVKMMGPETAKAFDLSEEDEAS